MMVIILRLMACLFAALAAGHATAYAKDEDPAALSAAGLDDLLAPEASTRLRGIDRLRGHYLAVDYVLLPLVDVAMMDEDEQVRAAAGGALATWGSEGCRRLVERLFGDPGAGTARAFDAANSYLDQLQPLDIMLEARLDSTHRLAFVWLTVCAPAEVADECSLVLADLARDDTDNSVRELARDALAFWGSTHSGNWGERGIPSGVLLGLNSEAPSARWISSAIAQRTSGGTRNPDIGALLARLVAEDPPATAVAAAEAIAVGRGELREEWLGQLESRVLAAKQSQVAEYAAQRAAMALARGNAEARIRRLLVNQRFEVSLASAIGLSFSRFHSELDLVPLAKALSGPGYRRRWASEAVARIGSPARSLLPAVRAAALDHDESGSRIAVAYCSIAMDRSDLLGRKVLLDCLSTAWAEEACRAMVRLDWAPAESLQALTASLANDAKHPAGIWAVRVLGALGAGASLAVGPLARVIIGEQQSASAATSSGRTKGSGSGRLTDDILLAYARIGGSSKDAKSTIQLCLRARSGRTRWRAQRLLRILEASEKR